MPVALTRCMSLLQVVSRKVTFLLSAIGVLGSVACAGTPEQPTYASTDIEVDRLAATGQPLRCSEGTVRDCTIWLGQHGDLANCVHGFDICSQGEWTGCVDDESLSENPELYSQLVSQ
jgi:hypothetical protein